MVKKINKDITIYELLLENPELAQKLKEMGLGCVGCPMAQLETIEMGAEAHGIDPEEIVEELNKELKNKRKDE